MTTLSFCGECGAARTGTPFCGHCGAHHTPAAAPAPPPPPPPTSQASAPPAILEDPDNISPAEPEATQGPISPIWLLPPIGAVLASQALALLSPLGPTSWIGLTQALTATAIGYLAAMAARSRGTSLAYVVLGILAVVVVLGYFATPEILRYFNGDWTTMIGYAVVVAAAIAAGLVFWMAARSRVGRMPTTLIGTALVVLAALAPLPVSWIDWWEQPGRSILHGAVITTMVAGILGGCLLVSALPNRPRRPIRAAPQHGFTPGTGHAPAPRTNPLAIVALVFGVMGGVLAIPLGHVARAQIRRTGEAGDGLAIAGLILGYIALVVWAVLITTFVVLWGLL